MNPLYLIVNTEEKHIEEKWIDSTGKNKEVLSKYTELWDGIKNVIGKIYDKPDQYAKDFIKIKFESSDDLPLNKPLKFHSLTLILKCIFKEENKYYPQIF